jgi:hypothetical protein
MHAVTWQVDCLSILDVCIDVFYAVLTMKNLSISCADGFLVISCGKVEYDDSS